MTFRLVYQASFPAGISPYRILDGSNHEIRWLNRFLDAQHLRNLSPRSLRSYGYDLLNFARWWFCKKRSSLSTLSESLLLDYVRYQLESTPRPTPQTVNHRLTVLRCLYRFLYGRAIPRKRAGVQSIHKTRCPLGFGKPGERSVGLRLKQSRRVIVPLSAGEVAQFWSSFYTYRDLSIIALLLFSGLRSRETMELRLDDLSLSEARLRVLGKGNRERVQPLCEETTHTLRQYIEYERPLGSSYLFLCLKGQRRGYPMTPAGFRSLFRHHRKSAQVSLANPHRFRHTFGADMVRFGVSLPALMHLMGHSHIQTTMLYVTLSPEDVWREYRRAVQNKKLFSPSGQ
jgi:integrase/recombinase XerD